MRILLVSTLFVAALCSAAEYPKPTGYLNDFASQLSEAQRASLEARLREYEQRTSIEIVVAIVPSLQGESVETYARGMFHSWDIGKRGKNNGVLFLWAPTERKVRIETGLGMTSAITDSQAAAIIREVTSFFRRGQYAEGLSAGLDGIMSQMDAAAGRGSSGFVWPLVVVGGLGLCVLLAVVAFRRRRLARWREEVPQQIWECTGILREAEAAQRQAGSDVIALKAEAPPEVWQSGMETVSTAPDRLAGFGREAATFASTPHKDYDDLKTTHRQLTQWRRHVAEIVTGFGAIGATLQAFRSRREESLRMAEALGVSLNELDARNTAGELPGSAETLLPAAQETYARARTAMSEPQPNWLRVYDLLSDVQDCITRIENPGAWTRNARSWPGSDTDSPALAALILLFASQQGPNFGMGSSSSGSDSGGGFFDGGSDGGGGGSDSGGSFGGGDSGGGGASGDY